MNVGQDKDPVIETVNARLDDPRYFTVKFTAKTTLKRISQSMKSGKE